MAKVAHEIDSGHKGQRTVRGRHGNVMQEDFEQKESKVSKKREGFHTVKKRLGLTKMADGAQRL
jgi:hypothetical protein